MTTPSTPPLPSEEDTIGELDGAELPVVTGLARDLALARMRAALLGDAATTIGRYRVIGTLGAGAMGVVYSAADPQLDRRVALKLVQSGQRASGSAPSRLRREARAMARLSHPNVVPVYEVLEHEGALVVVMELIDGTDLGSWIRTPRPWREALALLVDAGRGLAAAHSAGVVHRDFKPANVLVGKDGRARVTDFGLAREIDVDPERTDEEKAVEGGSDSLTRTGAILGTPAYLAPECYDGSHGDFASDQFAFAVTAFEVLYGRRPFAGRTVAQLARRINDGELESIPSDSPVPSRVHAAILQGLQPDKARRHPSMEAMVDRLQVALRPRGRRALWLAAPLFAAIVAIGVWPVAPPTACEAGGKGLADIWNDTRERALAQAYATSSVPEAETAWERIASGLRAYVAEWNEQYAAACDAEGATDLDRRMVCLRRGRDRLAAVLVELDTVDETAVERGGAAVDDLPPPTACANVDAEAGIAPPPAHRLMEVANAEAEIAAVEAANDVGRGGDALTRADVVVAQADAIGWAPLQGRAREARAEAYSQSDQLELAVVDSTEAFELALRAGDRATALAAALELAQIHTEGVRNDDAANTWLDEADRVVRLGGGDPLGTCRIELRRAMLHRIGVDLERAEASLQRATEACDAGQPPASLRTALAWERAVVAFRAARVEESESAAVDLVETTRRNLGPWHPEHARALALLAGVYTERSDFVRARATYEEVRAIYVRLRGADSSSVAGTDHNLGVVAQRSGDLDEALRLYERSRATYEALGLADAGGMHDVLLGLMQVHVLLGDGDEAREIGIDLLARLEAARGHNDPSVLHILTTLVNLEMFDNPEAALPYALRARDVAKHAYGDRHPHLAVILFLLSQLQATLDDPESALKSIEQSLAIREAVGRDPPTLGSVRYVHAQVLAELGRLREAREAAVRARLELEQSQPESSQLERIDVFIAQLP